MAAVAVFFATTDAGAADAVLAVLHTVFGGSAPAARVAMAVTVHRPVPGVASGGRLLYLFAYEGRSHGRSGICLHSDGASAKEAVCVQGMHATQLLASLKHMWHPRQAVRIEGLRLDLRDFSVGIGMLSVGAEPVGTVVVVSYKHEQETPEMLSEFVREYVLSACPDVESIVSPVFAEEMLCHVHLLSNIF